MKAKLLLLLMLLTSLATYAYDFESGGIYYNITSADDKTVEVTSGDTDYSGDVVIPETVTYSDAVYTVTTIGERAFAWCGSLISIELPASVTEIGDHAFPGCRLTSIELPSSVISIGDGAFSSCWSLTSIELPASVTEIGDGAFLYCSSLQEISVSEANENYTSVDGVLYNKNVSTLICCPGSKSGEFNVPTSVTTIGDYAFSGCRLTSIELPALLTEVGDGAFQSCSLLKKIEFPASVASIGESVFTYCLDLYEITVADENEYYTSFEGVLYDKNVCTLICCPCGKSGVVIVPMSVTTIGDYAFYDCESLTSIELPASVTEIGDYAFYACKSLTNVKLPASVTEIGQWAFYSCTSLTSIELPSSLTTIGVCAFIYCTSLTSIKLPASLTSIGDSAFAWCSSVKTVTSLNTEPPTLMYGVFESCPIETVYVPIEAVEAYQEADGWKELNIVGIDTSGVEDAIFGGDAFGEDAVESATVYTLQGVRVMGVRTMDDVKSLTPGLYIVNGKKVLVK